jgi:drug/metabolite transporter (DMT)-like permease
MTGSSLRGILALLVATGTFVLNDSLSKLVVADLPPMQTLFLRGVSAAICCIIVVILAGELRQARRIFHPALLLRGAAEVGSVICFFSALRYLPIADITALMQVAPLIVLLVAALFLKEKVSLFRWSLVLLGFAGALLVAAPGANGISIYAILGFGVAICSAARDLLTRFVPKDIPALTGTLSVVLLVLVVGGIGTVSVERWQPVTMRHIWLLAGAGILLTAAHLMIINAFRWADAGVVAPFLYSFTIWAVLAGLFIFGEIPGEQALLGMGLIVASGVVLALTTPRSRTG